MNYERLASELVRKLRTAHAKERDRQDNEGRIEQTDISTIQKAA